MSIDIELFRFVTVALLILLLIPIALYFRTTTYPIAGFGKILQFSTHLLSFSLTIVQIVVSILGRANLFLEFFQRCFLVLFYVAAGTFFILQGIANYYIEILYIFHPFATYWASDRVGILRQAVNLTLFCIAWSYPASTIYYDSAYWKPLTQTLRVLTSAVFTSLGLFVSSVCFMAWAELARNRVQLRRSDDERLAYQSKSFFDGLWINYLITAVTLQIACRFVVESEWIPVISNPLLGLAVLLEVIIVLLFTKLFEIAKKLVLERDTARNLPVSSE